MSTGTPTASARGAGVSTGTPTSRQPPDAGALYTVTPSTSETGHLLVGRKLDIVFVKYEIR